MRHRLAALILLLAAGPAVAVAADANTNAFVFGTFNQAALARFAPLPTPQADSTATGVRASVDWTNEFALLQAGNETLLLDGESVRIGLAARWDWQRWLFSAELPVINTSGGVLDSPIENWHHFFSLPNGNRQDEPRNQYHYIYQVNGINRLDINSGTTGIGDARLGVAHCADGDCWRTMLQLPTGDADQLLGGGLGLAGWYEHAYAFSAAGNWSGALAAGLSAVRRDGPLQDQQRSLIPFGWASLGYQLADRVDLGAQLYLHGPLYKDAEVAAMKRPGAQLAFGFRFRSSEKTSWWLGVEEDPITYSSPDFSIHFAADWH